MKRATALSLALALLVAGSLGLAAATLESTVQPEAVGGGTAQEASDAAGDGRIDAPQPPTMELVDRDPCVHALSEPPAIVGILLLLGLLFGYVYRDSGSAVLAALITAGPAIPIAAVWRSLTDCTRIALEEEEEGGLADVQPGPDTEAVLEAATGTAASTPTLLLAVGVFVTLAVGVGLLLLSRRGGADEKPPVADDADRDADVEGARRAAGAAADRIEAADDVDNEVYRAWRELAASLDVARPESSTPGEFATAAVESGLDPAAVSELTDAFERVRYGGAEPTAERRRSATAALRRIESGLDAEREAGTGRTDTEGDSTNDGRQRGDGR